MKYKYIDMLLVASILLSSTLIAIAVMKLDNKDKQYIVTTSVQATYNQLAKNIDWIVSTEVNSVSEELKMLEKGYYDVTIKDSVEIISKQQQLKAEEFIKNIN